MALADNITAYYKFDESSGNASDATGNGWTGTQSNSPTFSAGKRLNGADFLGSSSQAFTMSTSFPDFNSNTAFSFSFWMKNSATGAFWVGTRCDTSARSQWDIYCNIEASTSIAFAISPINNASNRLTVYSSFTDINDGNWHHYVITYSGSRTPAGVKIYIDGSSQTINTVTNTLSSNAPTGTGMAIGSRTATFGAFFTGSLDEFGIWQRELTSGEVTTLYNGDVGFPYPFTTLYTLVMGTGPYTLTGIAVALVYARIMMMGVGSYALTGYQLFFSSSINNITKNVSSWLNRDKNV